MRNVLEPTLPFFFFSVLRDFHESVTCIQKLAQILSVLLIEFLKTKHTSPPAQALMPLPLSSVITD